MVWRLIVAALLGVLFGFERTLAGKHAGMRTYALVSLGSCLFVVSSILSAFDLSIFPGVNPLYIAASVVVGIGFIGAGLSGLRLPGQNGEHPELTTATGVWVAAGIGMAVGFGLYSVAVSATILGVLIFWLFAKFERRIQQRWGTNRE